MNYYEKLLYNVLRRTEARWRHVRPQGKQAILRLAVLAKMARYFSGTIDR